jgi:hypothetical protein
LCKGAVDMHPCQIKWGKGCHGLVCLTHDMTHDKRFAGRAGLGSMLTRTNILPRRGSTAVIESCSLLAPVHTLCSRAESSDPSLLWSVLYTPTHAIMLKHSSSAQAGQHAGPMGVHDWL